MLPGKKSIKKLGLQLFLVIMGFLLFLKNSFAIKRAIQHYFVSLMFFSLFWAIIMKITLKQENEKKEPPIFMSESGPNFGLKKRPVGALL